MIEEQINDRFNKVEKLLELALENMSLLGQLILKRRQLEEEKEGEKDG